VSQVTTSRRSARGVVAAGESASRTDAAPTGSRATLATGTPDGMSTTTAPAAPWGRLRPGVLGVVALGTMLTLGVLVTAALVGGAADPVTLGDAGPVTRWGVLVARTGNDVAAIGTLGVLVVAVLLLPRADGAFGPDAARLVRRVSWWAAAWSLLALVTVVFTLSKVAGLPVQAVLAPDALPLVLQLETTRALLSSAWLAALVAIGARLTRSPATGLLLLLTAAGALVLPALSGHARHAELATLTAVSLSLHVAAAAAWVGGLAALIVHLRRSDVALAVALPRFSRLALVCFAAVGASGLVTAWASVTTLPELWTTPYGRLVLAKVAALVVLGAFGQRHRTRTVAAAAQRRPRAFVRLAAAEVVLMACAAALAVALSSTAPPPEPGHPEVVTATAAVSPR
jgi:putative copper export protein